MVRGFAGAFGGADVVGVGGSGRGVGVGAGEGVEVLEDADKDPDGGGEVERCGEADVRGCAGFHLTDAGLGVGL